MKKRYTKRQILESIAYWKKQLNENATTYENNNVIDAINTINIQFGALTNILERKPHNDIYSITRDDWQNISIAIGDALDDLTTLLGIKS